MQKNFGKIFWLIFKNFQPEFLDFGQKNGWFYKIFEKLKKEEKILQKQKIWVGRTHKTFFPWPYEAIWTKCSSKTEILYVQTLTGRNLGASFIFQFDKPLWYPEDFVQNWNRYQCKQLVVSPFLSQRPFVGDHACLWDAYWLMHVGNWYEICLSQVKCSNCIVDSKQILSFTLGDVRSE